MTKEILKLQTQAQNIIKKTKINEVMLKITKIQRMIKEFKKVIEQAEIYTATGNYELKNLDTNNPNHKKLVKEKEQDIRNLEKIEKMTKHEYQYKITLSYNKIKELEEIITAWEKGHNLIPLNEIELMTNVLIIKEQTKCQN